MATQRHTALAVALVLALLAGPAVAQERFVLWGDARKGQQVFVEKGCGTCHAIRGTQPSAGPDLGKIGAKHLTMTQIAGAMWNHAPAMKQAAKAKGIEWKPFAGSEMRDVIAFLYAVNLMDEPGNPRRGERLFVERGCATCHSVKGKGGTIGPSLERWKSYGSPILWGELMWSHALQMEDKVREFGLRWPRFEENEMLDLIAYIQRELGSRR